MDGGSESRDRQSLCILMKFRVALDLAIACKLSLQKLLLHASNQIYGKITWLLI